MPAKVFTIACCATKSSRKPQLYFAIILGINDGTTGSPCGPWQWGDCPNIMSKVTSAFSSDVTPEEKSQLQVIVLTLADPKGNWHYAWKRLCDAAGMDSAKYKPPFKTHPFPESQSEAQAGPGS